MQHQEIVLGRAGQAFLFDPSDGRPDASPAPTVCVLQGGRPIVATSGDCRIDPVETILHGDAHSGSKLIRVADPTGIVPGGRYLMTKPERDREWIEVVAVRDDSLQLEHPLIHRYAGAATIVGCRISIGLDPMWLAASSNLTDVGRHHGLAGYMLRWTYTVAGHEMTGVGFADLVRHRSEQVVTPSDLDQRSPGWISNLPPEHRSNQGADFIAEAFRAVRIEAVGDVHAQRKIRDTVVLRELVNARARVIRLEQDVMHGAPRTAELAIAEQRYRSCYSRLVAVPNLTSYVLPKVDEVRPKKTSEPGVRRRFPKLTNH